jgi:hypothetical protein
VINSTNVLGKHNPQWPISNAPETIKVPDLRVTGVQNAGDAIRWAVAIVVAWLTGLPRRVGRRLFYMNDLEARWRNWEVIETSGGLGRQYRDRRFDLISTQFPPRPGVPEAWDDHWDGRSFGSGPGDPPCGSLDGGN